MKKLYVNIHKKSIISVYCNFLYSSNILSCNFLYISIISVPCNFFITILFQVRKIIIPMSLVIFEKIKLAQIIKTRYLIEIVTSGILKVI